MFLHARFLHGSASEKVCPLTVNSKVNYNALANEPLSGNEIAVYIEETNISIEKVVVK